MANTPNKVPKRVVIYPRDIENITGLCPRTARQMHLKIRKYYGKSASEFVMTYEFSERSGIPLSIVESFIVD